MRPAGEQRSLAASALAAVERIRSKLHDWGFGEDAKVAIAADLDAARRAAVELDYVGKDRDGDEERRVEIAPGHYFDKREIRGVARHDHDAQTVFIFLRGSGTKWTIRGCTYEQACARLGWVKLGVVQQQAKEG